LRWCIYLRGRQSEGKHVGIVTIEDIVEEIVGGRRLAARSRLMNRSEPRPGTERRRWPWPRATGVVAEVRLPRSASRPTWPPPQSQAQRSPRCSSANNRARFPEGFALCQADARPAPLLQPARHWSVCFASTNRRCARARLFAEYDALDTDRLQHRLSARAQDRAAAEPAVRQVVAGSPAIRAT
jgi:hypothetical protein